MSQISFKNGDWTIMRRALIILGILVVGVAMWLLRDIILLVIASIFVVIFLNIFIYGLTRLGLQRSIATTIVLIITAIVTLLLALLVVPVLSEQFNTLVTVVIPDSLSSLTDWMSETGFRYRFPIVQEFDLSAISENLVAELGTAVSSLTSTVFPIIGSFVNVLLGLATIIFLVLFFVTQPEIYVQGFVLLFPPAWHDRLIEIIAMINNMLSNWLKATLLSMTVVGIGAWLGFQFMGLPQALVLGLIAGMTSFIPNFGPLFALVPAVIVSLAISPQSALLVVGLLYGLSFLQNQILNPLLMSEALNIPPALVLIGQIIGGFFFGFLGLLLAVPLTAILMILMREIYVKDILGHQLKAETSSLKQPG